MTTSVVISCCLAESVSTRVSNAFVYEIFTERALRSAIVVYFMSYTLFFFPRKLDWSNALLISVTRFFEF